MTNERADITLYLNRDNRWRGLHTAGLELGADGALRLLPVPLIAGALPTELADAPLPALPAGVAASPRGDLYFTEPHADRVLWIDGCVSKARPAPCIGGRGGHPGQFRAPRGILYHALRGALFVADSGNHRLQLFDPDTFQLLDIWGQPSLSSLPTPGSDPGRFDTPTSLAQDRDGNVYVVDRGNARVQQFDVRGAVNAAFWERVRAQQSLAPSEVAVGEVGGATAVFVLDAAARTIFVFDVSGNALSKFPLSQVAEPVGLAAGGTALYVGANGTRRIACFAADGTPIADARGYEGPVAALAVGGGGDLWVYAGVAAPVRLTERGAYGRRGALWGGPFRNPSLYMDQWHRLRALVDDVPDGAHLQLAVSTELPGPVDGSSEAPFAGAPWTAIPVAPDSPETLFPGVPLGDVWIGVALSGDGTASVAIPQLRLDFDHQTLLRHLPAIYQADGGSRETMARFLTLVEGSFADVEGEIDAVPARFDPVATPPPFLDWLAGWLALPLLESWNETARRDAIAGAFATYAGRGTVAGLRRAIRDTLGIEVHIEEPIQHAAWWALPTDDATPDEIGSGLLGFTTMLAVAEPQGAVVGTTAILDQSYLTTDDQYGAALFTDVAHQVRVSMYRGRGYYDGLEDAVRAVVDREKPAHVACAVGTIEPQMLLGFQARLGIDSIIGGGSPAAHTRAAGGLVLGGESAGSIGVESRIGQTTRLGDRTVDA